MPRVVPVSPPMPEAFDAVTVATTTLGLSLLKAMREKAMPRKGWTPASAEVMTLHVAPPSVERRMPTP